MKRLVLVLIAFGMLLVLAVVAAPLFVIAAIGLLLLAWKRPGIVAWMTRHPRLSAVPAAFRATPMRFAGSVAVVAFAFVAIAAPLGAAGGNEPEASMEPDIARASPTPVRSPEPTPRPTARLTSRPTATAAPIPSAKPTVQSTPTPEPPPPSILAPTGPTQRATVASVTDGDTIRVLIGGVNYPVRYIGIDTPETQNGAEWMGHEASRLNAQLVAGGEVVLEKDVSETDRYGRLLRHVWVEGDDGWLLVNLELLRRGVAQVTTYPPDVKYADGLYREAQREAREGGIGLWGAAPSPTPGAVAPLPAVPATCEPSYPDICIPIGSADLDCGDIEHRRFRVLWNVSHPDPHRFDGEADGLGCES